MITQTITIEYGSALENVPGAHDVLADLMQRYAVAVTTTRDLYHTAGQLAEHGFDTLIDHPNHPRTSWGERGRVLVTSRNLPSAAHITGDGIHFTTWGQDLYDSARSLYDVARGAAVA